MYLFYDLKCQYWDRLQIIILLSIHLTIGLLFPLMLKISIDYVEY